MREELVNILRYSKMKVFKDEYNISKRFVERVYIPRFVNIFLYLEIFTIREHLTKVRGNHGIPEKVLERLDDNECYILHDIVHLREDEGEREE